MKKIDRFIQSWRIKIALKALGSDVRVIDVGSHNGELFKALGSRLKEGFGIEPLCTHKHVSKRYTLAPGYFPNQSPESLGWDAITMLAVLEHIPQNKQIEIVQACHNFLKIGGLVIITVPSPMVDYILKMLCLLKIINGMSLEEHYGFKPEQTTGIFCLPLFRLIKHKRFQLGLNNLFIFEKIDNPINK